MSRRAVGDADRKFGVTAGANLRRPGNPPLISEYTRKINIVGKNFAERPGKAEDSEESVSFRQITHLYIVNWYNIRSIDGRRGWPPDVSAKRAGRRRFGSFAASPNGAQTSLARTFDDAAVSKRAGILAGLGERVSTTGAVDLRLRLP